MGFGQLLESTAAHADAKQPAPGVYVVPAGGGSEWHWPSFGAGVLVGSGGLGAVLSPRIGKGEPQS